MIACGHCEDEPTIRKNTELYRQKYGEDIPVKFHPLIRNREACFITSSYAVRLAREFNTRLHILHLSTADEMKLFDNEQCHWMKKRSQVKSAFIISGLEADLMTDLVH